MRRRSLLAGLAALLAAGGAAWRLHLFAPSYPPTPYDDLLDQITDRAPASRFGRQALATMPAMTAERLAQELRRDSAPLAVRASRDPGQDRLAEVGGWVVPRSVALYAALAASV